MKTAEGLSGLGGFYRAALLDDVIPFWLRHGLDAQHGGYLTALDRDGSLLDTDKSIWFQGRGAWMFATLYHTIERRPEWLDAARTGIDFLRRHAFSPSGKMYFSVTRDGAPLRMRRYVYSESFAAIGLAAWARAAGEARAADEALRCFETYLTYNFTAGHIPPKVDPDVRPGLAIGPYMIGIATAQQIRENLGDLACGGRTCTEWIDEWITVIRTLFLKPDHQAVMETVAPDGGILDHFDGRTLNPGHAIEAAWFILAEGARRGDRDRVRLGCTMLDWMWVRGWDPEHGGLFYFRDLRGLPVQEYWHDMKFWWPHCEALIATLLAWRLTGEARYARWHEQVRDWSFRHFADPEFGEWYGYLHVDGTPSVRLKGNLWKGPFHLPRMLWLCSQWLGDDPTPAEKPV